MGGFGVGRTAVFSYAIAGRSAGVGWELERGRPLAARADASTAAGRAQRGRASRAREASRRSEREERRRSDDTRAQRGAAREREGAFGNLVITAEVRYLLVTKHYRTNTLITPAGQPPDMSDERSNLRRLWPLVGTLYLVYLAFQPPPARYVGLLCLAVVAPVAAGWFAGNALGVGPWAD